MNNKVEKICRLCLKVSDNEFAAIEKVPREIFDALSLKTNLSISEDPVMCKNCAENLKKCFDFKSAYMDAENCQIHFPSVAEDYKVDIKDIILAKIENRDDVNPSVCRFCLENINENNYKSLDVLTREMVFAEDLPQKYLGQMDLDSTNDLAVCMPCGKSIKHYMLFIKSCWEVERRIAEYCKAEGTDSKGHVELSKVLQYNMLGCIKTEEKLSEIEEYGDLDINDGDLVKIEQEEVNIKLEEDLVEQGNYDSFQYGVVLPERKRAASKRRYTKVYKCQICTFQTVYFANFRSHEVTHKDASEITTYKCDLCPHETYHKNTLNTHMLIHKDPSEITMYKCIVCNFETKRRYTLKLHMLNHKDPSEITMYKCAVCDYETKWKTDLKKHIIVHRDPSNIKMFKCHLCSFASRQKGNLKKHVFIHMQPQRVTLYKCQLCTYESKQKYNFSRHLLIHKGPSEMYKCELCPYETKHKRYLERHTMSHKDPSEIRMYKCAVCTYEIKWKQSLRNHMRIHNDP